MSLFGSLKSISYRLWDEQSSKLISFAHLKRLKRQTKEVESRKADIGNEEQDRQNGTR